MKKFLLLILLMVIGCGKKENETQNQLLASTQNLKSISMQNIHEINAELILDKMRLKFSEFIDAKNLVIDLAFNKNRNFDLAAHYNLLDESIILKLNHESFLNLTTNQNQSLKDAKILFKQAFNNDLKVENMEYELIVIDGENQYQIAQFEALRQDSYHSRVIFDPEVDQKGRFYKIELKPRFFNNNYDLTTIQQPIFVLKQKLINKNPNQGVIKVYVKTSKGIQIFEFQKQFNKNILSYLKQIDTKVEVSNTGTLRTFQNLSKDIWKIFHEEEVSAHFIPEYQSPILIKYEKEDKFNWTLLSSKKHHLIKGEKTLSFPNSYIGKILSIKHKRTKSRKQTLTHRGSFTFLCHYTIKTLSNKWASIGNSKVIINKSRQTNPYLFGNKHLEIYGKATFQEKVTTNSCEGLNLPHPNLKTLDNSYKIEIITFDLAKKNLLNQYILASKN